VHNDGVVDGCGGHVDANALEGNSEEACNCTYYIRKQVLPVFRTQTGTVQALTGTRDDVTHKGSRRHRTHMTCAFLQPHSRDYSGSRLQSADCNTRCTETEGYRMVLQGLDHIFYSVPGGSG
jgi:hypothetical protein